MFFKYLKQKNDNAYLVNKNNAYIIGKSLETNKEEIQQEFKPLTIRFSIKK